MIGYVTLGTDNLDRARAFYDALLATIGATRLMQLPDDGGGFTMYGTGMSSRRSSLQPLRQAGAECGNGSRSRLWLTRWQGRRFHSKAL